MIISELQIVPCEPMNGLVGFAKLVIDNNWHFSAIAIYTRPQGGYRITYPTKKGAFGRDNTIYYPINKNVATQIEDAIIAKFKEVVHG